MLISLLFRNLAGAMNLPSQIGALTLDVTLEESHEYSSEVSDFPIEGGTSISDHVRLLPRQLTMRGFVTDTPLVNVGLPLGRSRASSAFFLLEAMWQRRIPIIVVSQLRIYRNVIIKSLTIPKERELALRFTAVMQELQIVSGQNVLIPNAPGQASAANGGGVGSMTASNVASPAAHSVGTDAGRQAAGVASESVTRESTALHKLIHSGEKPIDLQRITL